MDDKFDLPNGGERLELVDDSGGRFPAEKTQTPAERVRLVIGEKGGEHVRLDRFLFCQLDYLCHFSPGDVGWKQISRWIKYEEKVEMGNRWSKPHVATTSLHSVFEIRRGIAEGGSVIELDMVLPKLARGAKESTVMTDCMRKLTEAISEKTSLSEETTQSIYASLMKPHKHKHRKGKRAAGVTEDFDPNPTEHLYPVGMSPDNLSSYKPNKKLLKKVPKGSEAANILIGQCDYLDEPVTVFARLSQAAPLDDMTEVALPTRFIYLALYPKHSSSVKECEEIGRAAGTLFSDKVFCQVAYKAKKPADLVDGIDEYIDGLTVLPPSIWDPETRLEPPEKTLTEAKIEQRVMSTAGPNTFNIGDDHDDPTLQRTGRLFGGLINDMKRRYPLYWSDIKDGFSIQSLASVVFLYFACITPIVTFGGLLGDGTGNNLGTMESILSGFLCGTIYSLFAGQPLTIVGATGPMLIFESLLYSFCTDNELDFLAFRFWVGAWISLILFLFVAFDLSALVSYITRFTEECFATLISLIFIFEAFKKVGGIWKYYPVGVRWSDGLSCYCNPANATTTVTSTPEPLWNETFQAAYSFENFTSMISTDCVNGNDDLLVNHMCIQPHTCESVGWQTVGTGCDVHEYVNAVPDVFFLSVLIFLGTFTLAYNLKYFRNSPYLPSFVRTNISDFAVITSIVICVAVDHLFGLDTPKLFVPGEFKTTLDGRGWLANPMALPWYMILMAVIPAILATILIFLDQQITAVIVNRKEHKFRKGHGYHLDLFVLSFLIFACSLFGLPWFVAATVRAITHVRSLIMETESSAPGEKPVMLGVREQRLTGIIVHILIGASIFLTGILKLVPMPILYGVFLYMGITSLTGVQFIDRICLLFMPKKYQPDHIYLRHVKTSKVHLFTIIQIFCMVAMWVLKSISSVAIFFPVMILAICFIRKGLDRIFSQNELYWLDHLLPDATRRRKEDEPGHDAKNSNANNNTSISIEMNTLNENEKEKGETDVLVQSSDKF